MENAVIPYNEARQRCMDAVISGLLPKSLNEGDNNQRLAKAMTVALKGQEMGLGIMYALTHIHVIKGKITMSAELMSAQVYKHCPSAEFIFEELSNERCVVKARRSKKETFCRIEWTIADAKRAGLIKGDGNWEKYPRAMLRSRAISEICKTVFPDALMGVSYTPEELGADVDVDGDVVDVSHAVAPKEPVPKKFYILQGKTKRHGERLDTRSKEDWASWMLNAKKEIADKNLQISSAIEMDFRAIEEYCEEPGDVTEPEAKPVETAPPTPPTDFAPPKEGCDSNADKRGVTEKQLKRLFAIAKANNWEDADVKDYIKTNFDLDSRSDLNRDQYDQLCDEIEGNKK